jgi:hypothetical protein
MDGEEAMKSQWFQQECVLSSNIPQEYVPEYITSKFGPFAEQFEETLGLSLDSLWLFSFKLAEYLEFKKHAIQFRDEIYKFKSKEEYADLGFISLPTGDYIKKWKNIITVDLRELRRLFAGVLSSHEIGKILEIRSLEMSDLPSNTDDIRLPSKPIFQADENTLIVLIPDYLANGLPTVYEELSNNIQEFRESKGRSFEELVGWNLKQLPFKSLSFNLEYGGGFEVDSVLEFKKSMWFVEVSGHPPCIDSLRGNLVAIERDLDKSLEKCLAQGKRCFQFLNEEPLSHFAKKGKLMGVFIVVDGVYPQLNMNMAMKVFDEKRPVYIINWFDLRTLLDQPEISRFEDFLLWRIQQPMPIVCFDEKDYWGYYFDNYVENEELRRAFPVMQERHISNFFISRRFTNKEYLQNIA